MESKERQVKRILAFGASLTEGGTFYRTQNTFHRHPYTIRLQELLQQHFKTMDFHIDNEGISGERAQEMTSRLPKILQEKGPYDLVMILGGTNDLGGDYTIGGEKAVFDAIKQLHLISLSSGATTILMTLTESDYIYENMGKDGTSFIKEHGEKGRVSVNKMLREFAQQTDGVTLCDLDKEHPHSTLSKADKDKYWDIDGIHYTPAGYDRLGEIVFDKIKKFDLLGLC